MPLNKRWLSIRNASYFPKYSLWILLTAFLIISFSYNYHNILLKPAQSIHLWRQCDCLSLAMNYYQDNNPFLEPSVHYLGRDGTGKTASDFPIIYFTVGKVWQLAGHHEYLFRAFVLLLFLLGLLAVFKVFEDTLEDSIVALGGALFLFTSPVLAYYANNYLMDIPSFSLALIGLYFFYRYYKEGKRWQFIIFCLFLLIAGLIKISSLLSFVAIGGLFLLESMNVKLRKEIRVFRHSKIFFLVLFASVFAIQFIWFHYAQLYNKEHNSGIFLIGILPIWDITREQINIVMDHINVHIRFDYFRRETQIVFVLMLMAILLFFKRANRTLLLLTLMLLIGFGAFVLLFFQALKDHDYYTINLFILVPFVLLGFFLLLKNWSEYIFHSIIFKIILLGFLVHNITFTGKRLQDRYGSVGWENNYYLTNLHNFDNIEPYLDSIGILKEDRVISISDPSINISLYKMNRKGWTNYGLNADSAKIMEKIEMDARYLFVSDTMSYEEPGIQSFLGDPVGKYENIDIYRLKK